MPYSGKYREPTGVGYTGWLKIDGNGIPIRNCDLDKIPGKIIPDDLIHGSSGDNAASQLHFAWGANTYGGTIGTYLMKTVWNNIIKDWAINMRISPKDIIASPDNVNKWKYNGCLISSLTLSGTAPTGAGGTPVDVSFTVIALGREDASNENEPTFIDGAVETSNLNNVPVPYWRTKVIYDGFGDNVGVTRWSITVTNNTFTTYVFNNSQDPKFAQQGLLTVTGGVTLYSPDGVPIPKDTVGEEGNETGGSGSSFQILIEGQQGNVFSTLTIPCIVVTRYTQPFATPNAPVVRTVDFTGLGTATEPALKVS